jgi:hypothetical protein
MAVTIQHEPPAAIDSISSTNNPKGPPCVEKASLLMDTTFCIKKIFY